MDLIEILDKNLKTKNRIRDILGETNNISRYPIAIHNAIAVKYNEGWVYGYKERYFELTGTEPDVNGPEDIYEYGIDDTYYDPSYTTDVLTEIMKDCLNYRLGMKDELVIDTDEFVTYPDYLLGKIDSAYDLGLAAGKDQADEDYEGDEDVDAPVVVNDRNKVTITSEQDNVRIKYKFDENGVEYEYSSPIIISEDCTLYVIGIIGRSNSGWEVWNLSYDPTGFAAFIDPPVVEQDGNLVYFSCSLKNSTIEYKIDNKTWNIYTHPVGVTNNDVYIYARASRNGEFSSIIVQPIKHDISIVRPENVQCTIVDEGSVRRITLYCPTANTEIWYSLNTSAIPDAYFQYNGSFTTEHTRFTVYAYSQFTDAYGGTESPQRLYWKYDKYEDERPQKVNFYPNGRDLTLSCTTEGAVIIYQYGTYGTPQNSGSNYITLQPANGTKVIAYAILNGIQGDVSEYTFNISGSTVPPKPYAYQDENDIVHIVSSYPGRYTIDGSDPVLGIPFSANENVEIQCTKSFTLKAIAYNGDVVSEQFTGSFYPGQTTVNPGTGGSGGQGGTGTGEAFDSTKQWFWARGCTGVSLSGSDKGKLQYSVNGSSWVTLNDNTTFRTTDIVYFRANGLSNFNPQGSAVEIGGNINSLKDGKNFNAESSQSTFTGLFKNATSITQAVQLYLWNGTVLTSGYESMFEGCTNLLSAPELPASRVMQAGYKNMFKNCYNLSTVPNSLTATYIGSNAYESMFEGCSKLTYAPSLPLTTLSASCYARMFKGCTLLGTAPALPAYEGNGNLAVSCYEEMFMNCTSLTKAPYLPAVQLSGKTGCYNGMFNGCSNLTEIKAMFINPPTNAIYTYNWVLNVASYGTFYQNEEARWFHEGPNGIPEGWTVVNAAVTGTVQFEYRADSTLKMTSTTNDPIYWVYDEYKSQPKTSWTLYESPIPITKPCTIWACCKNKDGIYSEEVPWTLNQVTYPKLTATVINGYVSITPSDFYDSVQWALCTGENIEPSSSTWRDYTGKFYFKDYSENDSWISIRGYISGLTGGPQRQDWQYIIPDLTAPLFGDETQTWQGTEYHLTTRCTITWNGNESFTNPQILLKRSNESDFVSYGSMEWQGGVVKRWTYNLTINWSSETDDLIIYYAKVRVTKNGATVESSETSHTFERGVAGEEPMVTLYTPGIYNIGTNQWYITYPDDNGENYTPYSEWNNDAPEIYYSMNNEDPKNYKTNHPIDLSTMRNKPGFSTYVDLWVESRIGTRTNRSETFSVYFDLSATITTPGKPTINPMNNYSDPTHPWKFCITNTTYNGADLHEYNIEITGGQNSGSFKLKDIVNTGTWVYVPASISSATITAKTRYSITGVGEQWGPECDPYYYVNEYNPTNIDAPGWRWYEDPQRPGEYVIEVVVDEKYTSIYKGNDIHRYLAIDDADAWWNPNSTHVSFANGISMDAGGLKTSVYPGFYGSKIGVSGFKVWWEYDNSMDSRDPVISPVTTFEWQRPDAPEGFQPPEIEVIDGDWPKLIITNPNSGYDTYWRIKDAVFAGGTLDTTKYNTVKKWTWNYGTTLDQFIISGTVEAWSEDDDYTGSYNPDLYSSQDFYFGRYASLSAPTIEFTYEHSTYQILVANSNKYATNYWRKENESSYHVAGKYGSSLGVNPQSCYCYAYSAWGSQISSTVSAYFDNGVFTSYEAPTISNPTLGPDGITYQFTITNNSTVTNLYWKIDPTEWNVEDENYSQFNQYINNQKPGWWRGASVPYQSSYLVVINPAMISGFIQAKCSDSTNYIFHDYDNTTPTTTYQFVNGNYTL